ncbi:hypothetical protein K4749_17095 [Streptomyces sp. TRM72054]|uniref:hypothetical protein n=1 Tax=Streptomyces sp. TRM72054 TaxID=2870562 RepID=UPI001C8B2288|nr:hypothetical protein [Streptomyces sp. TRM72054]MBX9395266.1 hypothetical protein [Streptomyces sp. TRM72054]
MTTLPARALEPVEPEPGVLVHPSSDRRLAVEHWLLSTLSEPGRARAQWQEYGAALLPLGTLFSAVRIPARLVVALTASTETSELDDFLNQALDGGPVICDPHHSRYYALVSASMPATWRQAVDDWRTMDVDCLGRDSYLGVPPVSAVEHNPATHNPYWSVPMPSPGVLCAPLTVARLIAAGRHQLAEELDA